MLVSSAGAISSSIPNVNTDKAMTNVPAQIKYKNTGCDALEHKINRKITKERRARVSSSGLIVYGTPQNSYRINVPLITLSRWYVNTHSAEQMDPRQLKAAMLHITPRANQPM